MERTRLSMAELGSTGMQITRMGFGAWAIGGGGWEFGWGPQDDQESFDAIHRALELGVNWIDTAAAYGFGRSETVVGRALEGVGDRPYVFTKCSLLEGPGRRVVHVLERDSILREAEGSLKRLGTDYIDVYLVHRVDAHTPVEETLDALDSLVKDSYAWFRGLVKQRRGMDDALLEKVADRIDRHGGRRNDRHLGARSHPAPGASHG